MTYTIKKLPKSQVELTVTVPTEKLQEYKEQACKDLSHHVKVNGFRPGHVPTSVVEQNVDPEYIIERMQEIAIQQSYAEAVMKEEIQVISRPEVKIESAEPLTYVATVAVMPEVELKDHKSIKVPEKKVELKDEDMDEVINDMKKYGTIYNDVEREVKEKDRAEIDFQGFDEEGKEVPNTTSKNHPLVIGDKMFIPGFEEAVMGMKKGEEKEFEVVFPEDYHKEDMRKQKVKFKVTVNRIEEPQIPELNDELIEKMTGKKQSVEEFKKELAENIQKDKEAKAKQERENHYIEELLKLATVEIPDSLIEDEINYIIEDMRHEITHKGWKFEDFLAQTDNTIEKLKEKYLPEAEKRIKIRLSLQKLIRLEEISVVEDEVNEEIAKIKSHYPETEHAKIDEDLQKGHLLSELKNRLTLRKLFTKVL